MDNIYRGHLGAGGVVTNRNECGSVKNGCDFRNPRFTLWIQFCTLSLCSCNNNIGELLIHHVYLVSVVFRLLIAVRFLSTNPWYILLFILYKNSWFQIDALCLLAFLYCNCMFWLGIAWTSVQFQRWKSRNLKVRQIESNLEHLIVGACHVRIRQPHCSSVEWDKALKLHLAFTVHSQSWVVLCSSTTRLGNFCAGHP